MNNLEKISFKLKPKSKSTKGIHSELHSLVAELRADFGEIATKGRGSFSMYLGCLKYVPLSLIYRWRAEIKDSPNLNTPTARAKIFWWKFKKWSIQSKRESTQLSPE